MILCGSVVEVTRAQAHSPLELRGDARLSSLPFPPSLSPPQVPPSDSATFDPPRVFSLSASRSPSLSIVCSVSRFYPCLSFVDLPTPSLALCRCSVFFPSWKIVPSRFLTRRMVAGFLSFSFYLTSHLTSPHFTSPHLASPHPASCRLFRGSVSALRPFLFLFLPPVSRSVPDAFASSLPFDHNSRLTNIVNTPALSGETWSPRHIP